MFLCNFRPSSKNETKTKTNDESGNEYFVQGEYRDAIRYYNADLDKNIVYQKT